MDQDQARREFRGKPSLWFMFRVEDCALKRDGNRGEADMAREGCDILCKFELAVFVVLLGVVCEWSTKRIR